MPYTLSMFLLWAVLAAVVGGLVGWSLHAVGTRRGAPQADPGEIERLRRQVAELEAMASAGQQATTRSTATEGPSPGSPTASAAESTGDVSRARDEAELDAAEGILGRRIRPDDLTVVRGLSDRVAALCGGIGVTTWQALAATPVDDLHSMLDAAGETVEEAHLETWPRQAALLAAGDWVGFRDLVDGLGAE
jgi:predicted flap endonuclease-1-like 5' DNA nuclease